MKHENVDNEALVFGTFRWLREEHGLHKQTVMNLVRQRGLTEQRTAARALRIKAAAEEGRTLLGHADAALVPAQGQTLTSLARNLGVHRGTLKAERTARGITEGDTEGQTRALADLSDEELFNPTIAMVATTHDVHRDTVSRERRRRRKEAAQCR